MISCNDISLEIQENVTIQIYIDGSHLVNPVFNINFQQLKKWGSKQEYKRKKEDGGQNQRQKVMGTCSVWQGYANPCGYGPRVGMGMGTGMQIATPTIPVPLLRVWWVSMALPDCCHV